MRFGKVRRVHFVGIGGSGMCGIAEVLSNLGYEVSGSDLAGSPAVEHLAALGVNVAVGHRAENVGDADVVVVSSAIPAGNPEVESAQAAKVPVIPRAEMLAELMRMKFGVAVAGSHGKTSTTSMIAAVARVAGLDPTFVIGGRVETFGSSARLGRGELLVCEADESDGSFLRLSPTYAVVTNIDDEHLVAYGGSLETLRQAFLDFANKVPFYGVSVLCLDCTQVQQILPGIHRRYVTYGFAAQADVRCPGDPVLEGFSVRFPVEAHGERLGELRLQVPGVHSVQNALAAIAVGLELEIPFPVIAGALEAFHGADRRFQKRGEIAGVLVLDDYGHHPAEITATLAAAKKGFGRRLLVVFQPHRYTRVRDCREGFYRAFYDADTVLVTEVYSAGEEPIPGATGESLAQGIAQHGHRDVRYVPSLEEIPRVLRSIVRPGDIVITQGAGSVWRVGPALLGLLEREGPA